MLLLTQQGGVSSLNSSLAKRDSCKFIRPRIWSAIKVESHNACFRRSTEKRSRGIPEWEINDSSSLKLLPGPVQQLQLLLMLWLNHITLHDKYLYFGPSSQCLILSSSTKKTYFMKHFSPFRSAEMLSILIKAFYKKFAWWEMCTV